MKVFKFGGGILRNKDDIFRLVSLLNKYENQKLIIVFSAFYKVTSKFENLLNIYFSENKFDWNVFNDIKTFHLNLVNSIFENKNVEISIIKVFKNIENYFKKGLSDNYHFEYDKIVSYGELLSSFILSEFLKKQKFNCRYVDIRNVIITDSVHTEAKVNWEVSIKNIKKDCISGNFNFCVTQGFISSDKNGNATTLGREGSDFTASIVGFAVNAKEVVFWKEVNGIYNADPSEMADCKLIPEMSYKEAVEQAYYGAKILHPKTIKPLQNKKIPIIVKSFYEDNEEGTRIIDISKFNSNFYPDIPIFIIKDNQILISISSKDFSFITEYNLVKIYSLLSEYLIKVNLMESSAISFSVCVTNDKFKIPKFINKLKSMFNVLFNENLSLITIRHYNSESIKRMVNKKEVLIIQKSRHTARFVIK